MVRSAFVSAVAFLALANPLAAHEAANAIGRPVAALIGEPSKDPSAQPLVIELQSRAGAEPYVAQSVSRDVGELLWVSGAWDLDAPSRRAAMRFSLSGAFPKNAAARFDAAAILVTPRRAA